MMVYYTFFTEVLSTDDLYRDGMGEISHDPRMKHLKTRRERLGTYNTFKTHKKNTQGSISTHNYILYPKVSYVPANKLLSTRESAHTRFHDYRVIIISS